MVPGSVVEYWQGKELALGFCLGPENKKKIPIMTSAGRKDSLAAKKIIFHHSSPLAATAPREEVMSHLEMVSQRKAKAISELDTEELWELLSEEEPDKEWTLQELSEYLFSSEVGEWEHSTLYQALVEDRHRYNRKGDVFLTRSREQVEEAAQREITEKKRDAERQAVRDWIRQVWDKRDSSAPDDYKDAIQEWTKRIRSSAVHGEDSSHFQHVQRFLKDLDSKARDLPFQFMIRLGEWTQDENLEILANETPLHFSDEVLKEARDAQGQVEAVLDEAERRDLTTWPCHSIDDPDTTEIDDALSWRETSDGYELAIHIADASSLMTPSFAALEEEIRYRATSVYLPDLKVRMVPENLSDDALSLKQGVLRPAFTFLASINKDGKLLSSEMTTSKIEVAGRLDYDQADALVEEDDYWKSFFSIAKSLKAQREANGAVNLPFPRMDVRLEDGKIHLVPDERGSASQTIVSEMMILANRIAAEYLRDNSLPAIYRSQNAPNPAIEDRAEWKPHHLFEARKSFSRSSQGFEPALHSGLGLDCYVQATSPIRRYRDLVAQRQIKHHLKTGEVLYNKEQLEEILTITSTPVSQAERMERNRKSYFLHKLLKGQRGQEVEATVLAINAERYTLQLKESLREVDVPQGGDTLRAPGETVRVKIISVYPRDRVLKVSSPL